MCCGHRSAMFAAIIIVLGSCSAAAIGRSSSPKEMLLSNGLSSSGSLYLLEVDARLPQSLRALRKAEKQLDEYVRKRGRFDADIRSAFLTIISLRAEVAKLHEQSTRVPESDPAKYNGIVDQINQRKAKIVQVEQYIVQRAQEIAKLSAPVDHLPLTLDLANKMDAAAARYEQLAADPAVVAAINDINARGKSIVRLGPSAQFKTELPQVRRRRDLVQERAMRLDTRNGTPHVNVVLNETAPVRMVLDSGASLVQLTADVAARAGITVDENSPREKFRIADGSLIEVPITTVKTIQLGRFVAHDVVCAVIPQTSQQADCLLGGSFLQNFIYRVDLAAGELHMSPVTATTLPPDDAAAPTTAPTTAPTDAPSTQPVISGPAKTVAQARRETFVLEIRALIDGTDQLDISADGLTWTHGTWGWPSEVFVNDAPWLPRTQSKLATAGDLDALKTVDWSSARVIDQRGRGAVAVDSRADGLQIRFDDSPNGGDHYVVAIEFALNAK